jgi:hypothetical protein
MIRSPFVNFAFGIIAGACVTAAVTVHTITARAQGKASEIDQQVNALSDSVKRLAANAEEWKRRAEACETAEVARIKASAPDGWYTMLYQETDPQKPFFTDQNVIVAGLANAVRPGLGPMLLKLAPASTPELRLNGVLPGYVRPIVAPAHVRFVYTRTPGTLGETFPSSPVQ